MATLDPTRSINGGQTRPLSPHARAELADIAVAPRPRTAMRSRWRKASCVSARVRPPGGDAGASGIHWCDDLQHVRGATDGHDAMNLYLLEQVESPAVVLTAFTNG